MTHKNRRFIAVDILLLVLAILPLVAGMVLKALFTPITEGVSVSGALIYFTLPMPLQDLPITESLVNSWLVILSVFWLCLYLTHGIAAKPQTRRQLVVEWALEKAQGLVSANMDGYFKGFTPFITSILVLSALSSLLSLIGLYPPTSDLNIVGGWAILVFFLITYYKMKCGPVHYLKSFCDPVLLTPLNIISEVATPISMAFRHYGNVLSGAVIGVLVATGLRGLSSLVLGWLPGVLGEFPLLQIGLPAILSLYFDLFSGALQAFIFAMLTMLYISGGFPADDYAARKQKKQRNKQQ